MARAKNGTADLDRDMEKLRGLLGDRYDQIRDGLPELLERYGRLREPGAVKATIAAWRRERTGGANGDET